MIYTIESGNIMQQRASKHDCEDAVPNNTIMLNTAYQFTNNTSNNCIDLSLENTSQNK